MEQGKGEGGYFILDVSGKASGRCRCWERKHFRHRGDSQCKGPKVVGSGTNRAGGSLKRGNQGRAIGDKTKSCDRTRKCNLWTMVRRFPGDTDGKGSACNLGDPDSIPGSGRSPGEGNGYPFPYSCLENSMDRRAWQATVRGVAKSWTQLSG